MRSSLEGATIKPERRSGNTTRIIDNAIQILFEDGEVLVKDHSDNGSVSQSNLYILRKIIKRLDLEFQIQFPQIKDKQQGKAFVLSLTKINPNNHA